MINTKLKIHHKMQTKIVVRCLIQIYISWIRNETYYGRNTGGGIYTAKDIFQVNNQIAIKNKQKNSKVAFKIANSDI